MARGERRIADDGASRLFQASPAIVLLVSTQVATAARADEPGTNDGGLLPRTTNESSVPRLPPELTADQSSLLLPLDLSDGNDSRFLRQLLLTHGIEVDLDTTGRLGVASLEALAATIGKAGKGTVGPGIRVLDEDALDATLVIDMRDTLEAMPAVAATATTARTHYFRLQPIADSDDNEEPDNVDINFDDVPVAAQALPVEQTHPGEVTQDACRIDAASLLELESAFSTDRDSEETERFHDRVWRIAAERLESETVDPGLSNRVSRAWRRVWLDCSELDAMDIDALLPADPPPEPPPPPIPEPGPASPDSVEGLKPRTPDEQSEPALADPITAVTPRTPGELPESALIDPIDETTPETGGELTDPGSPEFGLSDLPESDTPESLELDAPDTDVPPSGDGEQSGSFFVSDDAPPGFEGLLGPLTQIVDLRFNESIIGTASITVTAETFTFDEPELVPPLLKGVFDPESLLPFLAGELETNSHLVCYSENDPAGCGVVTADPVAAIFDENTLTLDLFVSPTLQEARDLNTARYLDPPEPRGTSILSFGAVATDLQDSGTELDLFARGLAGYGRGHLTTEVEYDTRTEDARLRELRLTHFFPDHEVSFGSFFFTPEGGLGDHSLLGAQWRTSFKSRIDLEQAFSSDIVVYLPRRSVVQIAIDDRVFTGESYPAGNQKLDTRALPDGTYEIEIRILDNSGVASTEKRIFTKSADIPPAGEWVLSATAGLPLFFTEEDELDEIGVGAGIDTGFVDSEATSTGFLPRVGETSVIGVSASRRLTDQSAWRLGLLALGTDAVLQAGLLYIGQTVSAQFSGSVGTSGLISTVSRVSLSFGKTSASASVLTSRHQEDSDAADTELPIDDFDQVIVSLSRSFGPTSVALRGTWQRSFDDGLTTDLQQTSLTVRRSLFRRRDIRGFLSAEVLQEEDSTRLSLGVNLSFDRNRTSNTVFAGVEDLDGDLTGVLGVSTNYNKVTDSGLEWNAGAYATHRTENDSLGVSASLDHPKFSAEASSDWVLDNGSSTRNSVASLRTHAGIDTEGAAIGGQDFAESGLIVDVSGEPRGATFDVVVNNRKVAKGEIGSTQFVPLAPFEAYRVKLVPTSLLSNGMGEEIYDFTVFPGGVKRISIDARREVLLVASLVDDAGNLIIDALVETPDNPALVDSSGVFQAEVAPGEELIVKLEDGTRCAFTVPSASETDDILIPDTPLACYPAAAPPEVRVQ